MTKKLNIKRIYEAVEDTDGYRILVDRLWPRGVTKERSHLDEWNKIIAPSPNLRKWFAHKEERFIEFSILYEKELLLHTNEIKRLKKILELQPITLLYAAKSNTINHAKVLKQFIDNFDEQKFI